MSFAHVSNKFKNIFEEILIVGWKVACLILPLPPTLCHPTAPATATHFPAKKTGKSLKFLLFSCSRIGSEPRNPPLLQIFGSALFCPVFPRSALAGGMLSGFSDFRLPCPARPGVARRNFLAAVMFWRENSRVRVSCGLSNHALHVCPLGISVRVGAIRGK
ncbi:hypothetical protein SLEP1_g59188 [Rubroshorea leprosula]|uniref:Uncharacterized protein n=1 Tax=Rubroshorea leprosula TaxID=152421 RepID=A0AAV5MVP0_9ROSI|nr:hypothetical protein SLEP1_g59188 [Rubroshorea leprosula]